MLTSQSITQAFIYPFKDTEWFKKVGIGSIFMMVAGVAQYFAYSFWADVPTFAVICWGVSLVPLIHIDGYIYWLIQDHLQEGAEAGLPSWDDWHEMLNNGVRYWLVDFIYSLPALICALVIIKSVSGNLVDQATLIDAGALTEENLSAVVNTLLSIGLYSILSLFFSLIKLILLPPTLTHMIAKDNLKAALELRYIWSVFKRHPMNFLVPSILGLAFLFLASFLFTFLFALCFMLGGVIFSSIINFYLRLVTANLYSGAYRVNSGEVLLHKETGDGQ